MKLFAYPAVCAALLALSACATDSPAQPPQPQDPKLAQQEAAPGITGSRIPTRRTDKMVSATTGKDYEQEANTKRTPLIVN